MNNYVFCWLLTRRDVDSINPFSRDATTLKDIR